MLNRITVQLPVEGCFSETLRPRGDVRVVRPDADPARHGCAYRPQQTAGPAGHGDHPDPEPAYPRYINGKVTRVAVSAVELTGTRYAVYQLTVERTCGR